MNGTYTIDASVFLNAFNPYEAGHEASLLLLARLREQAAPLLAPTLVLPEVAAAIARGRQDEALANQFAGALARLPNLVLIPVDLALAQQAVVTAARYRLRGSDAAYVAVALRFGSTLVTLDREQRERSAAAVTARMPVEVLAEAE